MVRLKDGDFSAPRTLRGKIIHGNQVTGSSTRPVRNAKRPIIAIQRSAISQVLMVEYQEHVATGTASTVLTGGGT